jgi:DNA invertase Pin-like site-specific DNA recombinase
MPDYVIAKYIRLSIDDSQSDSMSIENQRLMLDRYIAELDIPNAEVLEFVDNGNSGTNFERPAVQALLELVRSGEVNCIAVKDFSRFGRNAIETGYFIERLFPLYRVRFISLAECFDSNEHIGDTGGLEVSFHFLKNEWYSRDLSRKIRAARREQIRRGEFVTKNCAFGYRLNESRRYEIDEPAADTVRMIFRMYSDGMKIADIQHKLYADRRPMPSEYKRKVAEPKCIWGKPVLQNILDNEQYIGTYVAGKTVKEDICSKKTIQVPKAEWTRIPNHHAAIVDKALFDAAQQRRGIKPEPNRKRKLTTTERYKAANSVLSGKVVCGCCGHKLRLSTTRNAAFYCSYTHNAPDMPCHGLRIGQAELEVCVYDKVAARAREIVRQADSADDSAGMASGKSVDDEMRCMYERFVAGELSADEFKRAKAALAASRGQSARQSMPQPELRRSAELALRETALTRDVLDALVESVRVSPDGSVDVAWKCDSFADII